MAKYASMTRAPTPASPAIPQTNHTAHTHHARHHHGSFHSHVTSAVHKAGPETIQALRTAMAKESVPATWENSLRYIMEHESGGQVGAANRVDTARGLFQLTRASYPLNPNGAASFGNPVEEAQGGIRYIQKRYQTADTAAAFWQRHGWY